MISIVCLIYQSTEYAQWCYESAMKWTPELHNGEAEFYFIANDPTDELLDFLKTKKYPYYLNINPKRTDKELFSMGYAWPEYIHRVYRGYNYGIQISKNPIVCLINSDMGFSPDWLKNMRKNLTLNTIVGCTTIQPSTVFRNPKNKTDCHLYNCGATVTTFDEEKFLIKANEIRTSGTSIGNLFMPLMLYKEQAERVGYYPEGNLHGNNFNVISVTGDHAFINKLEKAGIKHIRANDSVIYHFAQGEKKEKI